MAFLKLNGYTVPVVTKGSAEDTISGFDGEMSIDGTPMRDRQNTRRQWSFETPPMDDDDAEGLVGLIQGRGQSFPYTSNLYSSAGHAPYGTPVATIIPGNDLQSIPQRVYLESTGELEAKFWGNALEMGPATENLLAADSRDAENAPTGYAAYNGTTLAAETTIRVQGSKSAKCTCGAGTSGGIQAASISCDVSTTYTFSVYMYTTLTKAFNLRISDNSPGQTIYGFTSVPNVWQRVTVSHTTPGAGVTTITPILYFNASGVAGDIFYTDMWQVEEGAAMTPWVDGTRGNPTLRYDGITDISDNLTLAAWVRPPTTNPVGTYPYLFFVYDTSTDNRLGIYRNVATNTIVVTVRRDGGTIGYATYSTSPWDDEWHHIAVTAASRTLGGYRKIVVYYDGAPVITSSGATNYPRIKNSTNICRIGSFSGGTYPWEGPIQDVQVLPYALSADQIAGLASRTVITPGLPLLDAQGDFDGMVQNATWDYNHKVIGSVSKVDYVGGGYSGTYRSYGKKIYFDLLAKDQG